MYNFKYSLIFSLFLLFNFNNTYSETFYIIPNAELDELINLYETTDGDNWTINDNWDNISATFTLDKLPYGVTLGNFQLISNDSTIYSANVTELDLTGESIIASGNNLFGEIPNFNLPFLSFINFNYNKLYGEIPNFNLPRLRTLFIGSNNFTGNIPNFDLPWLTQLFLDNNKLTGTIPNFDKMPLLQSLGLSRNQLTGTIPNFQYLNLFQLSLFSNNLSGKIPKFNFSNLIFLHLYKNSLTGEIPVLDSPNLFVMNLQNNKLTGAIPDYNNYNNLDRLAVYGNLFTFESLELNSNKIIEYLYTPQDTVLPVKKLDEKYYVDIDGSANQYHWFIDGEEVQVSEDKYFSPLEDGLYYCEVTNSLLPDLIIKSDSLFYTSVENSDKLYDYLFTFPPYPIPAISKITIPVYWTIKNPVKNKNITIYNNRGKRLDESKNLYVNQLSAINGEIIWESISVNPGIYFVEIKHGKSNKFIKIIVSE